MNKQAQNNQECGGSDAAPAQYTAALQHIETDHEALRRVWQLADAIELGADAAEGIYLALDDVLAEVAGQIRAAVTGD